MNYWLLSACGLTVLTIGAHVLLGGPEIHTPVLQSALSPDVKAVVSVIWHGITAVMGLSALWLGLAITRRHLGAVPFIAAQYFSFSALFLFYGATWLGSAFVFPQWYIFLILGALASIGYWRRGRV